ncbi:MAG TPA: hypothetical protein VNI53_07210 [Gammaproteobacteria bacterium]|nr:hypothetical protein [Gammaproteobacteria bacterium]
MPRLDIRRTSRLKKLPQTLVSERLDHIRIIARCALRNKKVTSNNRGV